MQVPRYNEIAYKIVFSLYSSLLSIRYFDMGRSNKVRHWFRFFLSNGQLFYSFIINFFNFGTNVSRRLAFITLSQIFPKITAATHGKRTESRISSNSQSWPAWMTFELRHYVRLANHRVQPRLDIIRWRHLVYRWTRWIFHFLSSEYQVSSKSIKWSWMEKKSKMWKVYGRANDALWQ